MKRLVNKLVLASLISVQSVSANEAASVKAANVEEQSSFQLKVSSKEGEIIDEIITTMGKTNVIALGFKQGHLKALGAKLHGVGALQFLAYIFSHKELKSYMGNIRKSSFKWNGFMSGIITGLNKEADTGELQAKLPGFAKLVDAQYEPLLAKAKERDWDGFVTLLIKT